MAKHKTDLLSIAKQRKRLIAEQEDWAALTACDDAGRPVALGSDTAFVSARSKYHATNGALHRLDVIESLQNLDDFEERCKALGLLAAAEGSHGPAKDWLRMAEDARRERVAAERAEAEAAKQVADPAQALIQLVSMLRTTVPQGIHLWVADVIRKVLVDGVDPADIQPPQLRVVGE